MMGYPRFEIGSNSRLGYLVKKIWSAEISDSVKWYDVDVIVLDFF